MSSLRYYVITTGRFGRPCQFSILNFQYNKGDNKEMRWYNMTDSSGGKLDDRLNIIFIDLVSIRKLYKKTPEKQVFFCIGPRAKRHQPLAKTVRESLA